MNTDGQRATLQRIARRAMTERGLLPDFSPTALAELNRIQAPPAPSVGAARDLRELPWASIATAESRDLDQLTVAQPLPDGAVKILVAVADVDGLVCIRRNPISVSSCCVARCTGSGRAGRGGSLGPADRHDPGVCSA